MSVAEALWLAAAVAIPLAFSPWTYNAFELPKAALLRALALLLAVAALVRLGRTWATSGPLTRLRPALPLFWPALALGLALAVATALSANPRASLWGSYERQQGLLTLASYLVLFLCAAGGLRSRRQIDRLWAALVWGSAPIVAYGLLQGAGLDPLPWHSDASSPVLSTIGRANFLGSYLVLALPLTMARLLQARRRWPYAALLAGQVACLALAQARAAWLGLGVAALAFALSWAAAVRSRRPALTSLGAAALLLGFVVLLNLSGGPLAPLGRLPGLDRLATLARTDGGSSAARLTIWRATLRLVAARPWLGYGPEAVRPLFARVFPPELVYYQGRFATVDRAHNLWLDLLMSAGLPGLLAYGALVLGFARLAWRGLRRAPERRQALAWAALVAAVAGHLADLQFSFDLTSSATVFWLILALAAGLALDRATPLSPAVGEGPDSSPLPERERAGVRVDCLSRRPASPPARPPGTSGGVFDRRVRPSPYPLPPGAREERSPCPPLNPLEGRGLADRVIPLSPAVGEGPGVRAPAVGEGPGVRAPRNSTGLGPEAIPPALVALALIALICGRPLLADAAFRRAQTGELAPAARLAAAAQAVRYWPLEPDYRLGLAYAYLDTGRYAEAIAELAAADRLSPEDPKVWAARGETYARWAAVDPARWPAAEAACRRALDLAPNLATFHTALGLVLAQEGRLPEAVAEVEHAVALDATDWIAYRHLADLYAEAGQPARADWAARQAALWQAKEEETAAR